MRKIAVCFTDNGKQLIEKINTKSSERGISPVEAYVCSDNVDADGGFKKVLGSLTEWTGRMFVPGNALIFVGAAGIAVRAISGFVKDKLCDCPVIVIDDNGRFVIPILSGHAGGANKLAMTYADLLDAVPVITTSTDVNDAFSVDAFAVENRLNITDRNGIKNISVKAVEGRKITLSIKDFPPKEKVDVIVADETDKECSLLLTPKRYTVGIGMKKNKDSDEADDLFIRTLNGIGATTDDVYAICTIDIKEDEDALIRLRDRYRIPVISFDSALLKEAEGDFTASEFVEKTVGVDNVCERAAILGAGAGSKLVRPKESENGMTIAIAERGSLWGRFM